MFFRFARAARADVKVGVALTTHVLIVCSGCSVPAGRSLHADELLLLPFAIIVCHEELNHWTHSALFNAGLEGGGSKHRHPTFMSSPLLHDFARHAKQTENIPYALRKSDIQACKSDQHVLELHLPSLHAASESRVLLILRAGPNAARLRQLSPSSAEVAVPPPLVRAARLRLYHCLLQHAQAPPRTARPFGRAMFAKPA